jgi:hypothetical protein
MCWLKEFWRVELGLLGVIGERVLDTAEGGLMGDRFVGEATVRQERLRDSEEEDLWRCGCPCMELSAW